MAVDAKYGRPNLPLRVTSEKYDASWVCCGYCSIQMVGRVVRPDANDMMSTIAHDCRACCGRPHNNGSNSSETRNGIWEVEAVDVNSCSTADIPAILKDGRAVQFCCEYAALPSYVKTQGGSFGHSVCLYGWTDANGGCVGFYDPLYNQDSNGLWARWSDVKGAGWGGDAHNASVKGAPTPPEPEPPEEVVPIPYGLSQDEVDAIVTSELLSQQDRLVAWWAEWLRGGKALVSDVWDTAVWSDPLVRSGVELDPCAETPPPVGGSWVRTPEPFPVAEAAAVVETAGAWDSANWREAHWM